jgi:hAT family C-terminal dimerisation region
MLCQIHTFYQHKDRDLINLVLTEANWNCVSQLIEVLVSNGIYSNYKNKKRRLFSATTIVTKFFNEPLALDGTNVLQFWKANAFNYPILSAMAKDYLTVQASSVPSERAFSSGVDLVTADRCRLTGNNIEMTQFLKFIL